MGIKNFHEWHAKQDAEWHERRRRLALEAIALCDHIATPEELAQAWAVLEAPPSGDQPAQQQQLELRAPNA